MIPCSFSRIAGSVVRPLLTTALLALAAGTSTVADAELIQFSPRNMVDFESYYEINYLADAAQKMRQDADRLGLNIHAHLKADKSVPPFSVLSLPVVKISPDFSDRSYITVLEKKSLSSEHYVKYVAILAVYRELSIDEVAKILESGIQILQNLFAGPGQPVFGGLLVKGRAADLVDLQNQEYFAWLGEYSADLKIQPDLGASSIDRYSITLYKRRIENLYLVDLVLHEAKMTSKSERSRRIGVECSWEAVQKLCDLDWVRSMYPIEYDEPN